MRKRDPFWESSFAMAFSCHHWFRKQGQSPLPSLPSGSLLEPEAVPVLPTTEWNALSDDLRQMILSFLLGDLKMCGTLMAMNHQSCLAVKSPNAWRDSVITVPREVTRIKGLLEMARNWKFASKAILPAFPQRKVLEEHLRLQCPALTVSVKGEGPVMFFVMSCRLRLGTLMPLHFFEPRYRYMCRHLSVGGVFGFLNEGRGVHCGVSGVLCEVMDLSMNSNGTYDALILAKSSFTLAEVWMEPMPRGDPLAVGFITAVDGAATAPASAVGRRNTWRCLQGWRWLRCRR